MIRAYRVALICGAVPLFLGVSIFMLWQWLPWAGSDAASHREVQEQQAGAAGEAPLRESPAPSPRLSRLPLPEIKVDAQFYTLRSGSRRCGLQVALAPILIEMRNDIRGSRTRGVYQHVRYRMQAERHLGVPVDSTVHQVVYRAKDTGEVLGFAVAHRRTLAPDARLPHGAAFEAIDQFTEAIVGRSGSQRLVRVVVTRGGKEFKRFSLPLDDDVRIAEDLTFIHRDYNAARERQRSGGKTPTGKQSIQDVRFRMLVVENLSQVEFSVRRVGRERIRLKSGKREDVIVYELHTTSVGAASVALRLMAPHQRLCFRAADGTLVRSHRPAVRSGAPTLTVELSHPIKPSVLERLPMRLDRLKPAAIPFPLGQYVEYQMLAGSLVIGKVGLRFSREKDATGTMRLRAWSEVTVRTKGGAGRDEEAVTFYDDALLPVEHRTTGTVRAAGAPAKARAQAKSDGAGDSTRPSHVGPDGRPDAGAETSGFKLHAYRYEVTHQDGMLHARNQVDEQRREKTVLARGPVYVVDTNLIHPWVLLAAGLELEEDRRYRIALFHVKQMRLAYMNLQVGKRQTLRHDGRSVLGYLVDVSAPQLELLGRMMVDEHGRLLNWLQIYPDGKHLETKLASY